MTLFTPLENRAPRPRSAVRLWAVGVFLLAGVLPAMAQLPAVPVAPIPAGAGSAVSAGKSIWSMLGFKGGSRLKRLRDALVNRRGNFPGLEKKPRIKSLTDPDNLASDNPAIKQAAQTKSDADAAPQKIKAIKYLATVGCASNGCNPGIKSSLLAALDDCTEEVRYEAAKAFLKAAGEKCDPCRQSCCDKEVTDKFFKIAYDRDEKGCFIEISPRVRKAARQVLCICCQPGPGSPVPPPKEGPPGEELDVPAKGPEGAPPAATAHNPGVSPFSPAVVRSMFVPRSIADALPTTAPSVAAPPATIKSTTVQAPGVPAPAVAAPATAPATEEQDEATNSIAGFLDPRIRRSDLPRRVVTTTTPADSEPRPAAETSAAIEQAAATRNPTARDDVQNARYDEPVGASHDGKILLTGEEDLGEYDINMQSQMRRAFAERFGFNTSTAKPEAKAKKGATAPYGAPPTSWTRTVKPGQPSFQAAASPTVPDALRDIATAAQPAANAMLPEALVHSNPNRTLPNNRPVRDPSTFARMNPPPAQPGMPQPGFQPQAPENPTAGYPPAGNPQASYPPANYPPAGYPPAQHAANSGLPPDGYPPADQQPSGYPPSYPGANPVAAAPQAPVERPAPTRQPANDLWAPEYQATPAPPPEPIAALSPPDATIRYGAARPMVRFGEVKPLVRYGQVQAIPDGQTAPAPAEESAAATEEELDALFPPSARANRKAGTGAWTDVYLFRRASEFSSNLGPGLNVDWNRRADHGVVDPQMLDRQMQPGVAPQQQQPQQQPAEGRTAELEGTIYRR